MPVLRKKRQTAWFLEGFTEEGKTWIINLEPLPFIIGRQRGCHLRLSSSEISRRHAIIFAYNNVLGIKEFGSTNGTFVNHQRLIGERTLQNGDILHFGPQEFRISCEKSLHGSTRVNNDPLTVTLLSNKELSHSFAGCETEFAELLSRPSVISHFQPIVQLADQKIIAYELLGRGAVDDLPTAPWSLLQIAKRFHKDVELSELFRRVGVQQARVLGNQCHLFVNTVPAEMNLKRLRLSLEELRLLAPELPLTLEMHETAVADLDVMHGLRTLLAELNIGLAYDDFGAGQARLVELIEVPPDYLKFDIILIRNIHRQASRAQQVLKTLVGMAQDLGIKTVAEGIELKEELEACVSIGFDLAQGYYLGKPEPAFCTLIDPMTNPGLVGRKG